MRLTKLNFIIPSLCLGLALVLPVGCRKTDRLLPTNEGDTSDKTRITLAVAVSEPSMRGTIDQRDQDPMPGTGEGKVSRMNLWMEKEGWKQTTPDATEAPVYKGTFEVSQVQKPSENRHYTILLNGHKLPLVTIPLQSDATVTLDQLGALIDPEGFTMTGNTGLTANVRPGIETPARPASNYFPSDAPLIVERVVSRVQVRRKPSMSLSGPMAKGRLDIDGLTYAVAGSALKVYLFRDHAGADNKINNNALLNYKGKSYIHDRVVPSGPFVPPYLKAPGDQPYSDPFLQRVSDYKGKTGIVATNFAAKRIGTSEPGPGEVTYCLENSNSAEITKRNQLEYNRITYVKVYGTFTPSEGLKYDPSSKSFGRVTDFAGGTYSLVVDRKKDPIGQQYDKNVGNRENQADEADMWGEMRDNDTYTLHVKDPQGTFYVGCQDRRVYADLRSAVEAGNVAVDRYVRGRMVWLTPANAQYAEYSVTAPGGSGGYPSIPGWTRNIDDDTRWDGIDPEDPNKPGHGHGPAPKITYKYVKNADTRRNNIYDLTLEGISDFGLPFDPIDPEDPNIPWHKNPLMPLPDGHIKVDPPYKSRITIKATVLKWNVQELNYSF